jgi:hypothetical protein
MKCKAKDFSETPEVCKGCVFIHTVACTWNVLCDPTVWDIVSRIDKPVVKEGE